MWERAKSEERHTDHSLSFAALSLLSYVRSVNVGVGVGAGSSVVVVLSRTLFRKQVVVVTHTNTGAAKQKRRVYFSLPFLLPPFFAIFTKFSTNPQSFFQEFIHNCTHTLHHYCELSNRIVIDYRFLFVDFLFATPTRTRTTLRSQQKSLDN